MKQQSGATPIFFSWPAMLVVLVLFVLMIKALVMLTPKFVESIKARSEAEADLQDVHTRQTTLQDTIERLSDERGREAEIRNRFNVGEEGEKIFIILEDTTNTATDTEAMSWWQKFLNWF